MRHFDRHAVMTDETRSSIMSLIREVRDANEEARSIENMLYGLFDGFDYSERITKDEHFATLPADIQLKLIVVCDTVRNYPTNYED